MPRMTLVLLLALAACAGSDSGKEVSALPSDPTGWRLASGKPPSQAEFVAVVASCQAIAKAGPLDRCLSDLGLRRVPQ